MLWGGRGAEQRPGGVRPTRSRPSAAPRAPHPLSLINSISSQLEAAPRLRPVIRAPTATWPANGVPYVVQGSIALRQSSPLDPVPVLTIAPGTEVRFAGDSRLRVGDGNDGVLDARGTSSDPITFTSADTATPAFWRGIDFDQGSDGSILDWVVVSYGGRSANTGNVNFRSGSVVTIGAAVFTHSEDYAAVVYSGSAPMFTGPSTDRMYTSNGQQSNPGLGDPAFDCVRDVAASVCTQP